MQKDCLSFWSLKIQKPLSSGQLLNVVIGSCYFYEPITRKLNHADFLNEKQALLPTSTLIFDNDNSSLNWNTTIKQLIFLKSFLFRCLILQKLTVTGLFSMFLSYVKSHLKLKRTIYTDWSCLRQEVQPNNLSRRKYVTCGFS